MAESSRPFDHLVVALAAYGAKNAGSLVYRGPNSGGSPAASEAARGYPLVEMRGGYGSLPGTESAPQSLKSPSSDESTVLLG